MEEAIAKEVAELVRTMVERRAVTDHTEAELRTKQAYAEERLAEACRLIHNSNSCLKQIATKLSAPKIDFDFDLDIGPLLKRVDIAVGADEKVGEILHVLVAKPGDDVVALVAKLKAATETAIERATAGCPKVEKDGECDTCAMAIPCVLIAEDLRKALRPEGAS